MRRDDDCQNTGADTPAAETHAGDGRGVDHGTETELGIGMIAIAADILDRQAS